jgi:6-phosphogluconolactonase
MRSSNCLPENIILVPDLGADRIARYVLNTADGKLSTATPAEIRLPPGSGPRHLVPSADGKRLYILSELANTVTVVEGSKNNTGRILETAPLLPSDSAVRGTAAEIVMHPNGRYLYASTRGTDNIVVFAIDRGTGKLTRSGSVPTGAGPRFFTIDASGKWLLAAGQVSNTITVFAIDPAAGLLNPRPNPISVPAPVFMGANGAALMVARGSPCACRRLCAVLRDPKERLKSATMSLRMPTELCIIASRYSEGDIL